MKLVEKMFFFIFPILFIVHRLTLVSSVQEINYRLPDNSIPESYEVKLDPHLEVGNFTFTGDVKILIHVTKPSKSITLHSKQLTIFENRTELRINSNDNLTYLIQKHEYDVVRDFLTLKTFKPLPKGTYVLKLHFVGVLSTDNVGFYRSFYKNSTKGTVWIATTQFESTFARSAFPCFDEPALKAIFQITIKRNRDQIALSNTAVTSEIVDSSDGKIWTEFAWTPKMPTYIVAFVVANYRSLESLDNKTRVWTKPDSVNETKYALQIGTKFLEIFSQYLNMSYFQNNITKLDHVSIPDFKAGAMENWGLITYRERVLLFQEGITTNAEKQSIAMTICHECSHQWFGNLVSPFWWSYLWLNEGFATYFKYFGCAWLEPKWRLEEKFVVEEMHQKAFKFDVSPNSHPMNGNGENPSKIANSFDGISYSKAACIIRMLRHIITEPVFKAGLRNYLTENQYGSTTPLHVWQGMQKAVDQIGMLYNISKIMNSWVNEKGIPLVTVTRNYIDNSLHISQEIFSSTRSNETKPGKWWIPLNGVHSKNLNFAETAATKWISGTPNATFENSGASLEEWLIINNQQTGYYRVMYDLTNWKRLITFLNTGNHNQIHPINRAQLIDDSLTLAKAGYLNYTVALGLFEYLRHETDYIPWNTAFSKIQFLDIMMGQSPSYEVFTQYVRILLTAAKDSVGIQERPSDEMNTILQRNNIQGFLCYFGSTECNQAASMAVQKWMSGDKTAIPRNLKNLFYCSSIRTSDSTHWNRMWRKYIESNATSEKISLLVALGCSNNKATLQRFMTLAITPNSEIRSQDSLAVFNFILIKNPRNVDIVLDYIIANFTAIVKCFPDSLSRNSLLSVIGQRITKKEQFDKMLKLTFDHFDIIGPNVAVFKKATENIIWIEKYQNIIGDWCSSRVAKLNITNVVDKKSSASHINIMFGTMLLSMMLHFVKNK